MSDEEICREYRLSKDKWEMTEILAELNMKKRIDILEILIQNGEDVRKPIGRKGRLPSSENEYYRKLQIRLDQLDDMISKYEEEYREVALLLKSGRLQERMGHNEQE